MVSDIPLVSTPSSVWKKLVEYMDNYVEGTKILMDPPEVKVGVTPHKVVYEENTLKLLHYSPPDRDAHREPLLMVYALVNKPYILDLQPNRSVIANLMEQGFDIYLIDWGTPEDKDMFLGLDDYVNYFIDVCVDKVRERTGHDKISVLGYCMGGTLCAMYSSLHREKVKKLILMAAPLVTIPEAGLLNHWAQKEYFDAEQVVEVFGNVPDDFLNGGFLMLDPIGNIVGKYLGFYNRVDNEDFVKMFLRMEKWIGDGIPVAGRAYEEFIKAIYQENKLARNEMYLDGKKVDIKNIDMPVMFLMGEHDHLVPPETTKEFAGLIGSDDVTIIENNTGHIGLSVSSKSHRGMWADVGEWLLKDTGGKELSSVKGIGDSFEKRLNEVGIEDTDDLLEADIDELAEETGIGRARIEEWVKYVEGDDGNGP